MPELERGTVEANGLEFHYLASGSGPLALCLHGFPDSPWTYRHLLPELGRVGYRAVAPFNRGFAPTELPADRHHVHTSTMVADALALNAALGGGPDAPLIAHDWGAVAAWGAAGRGPDRWGRCVILNIPPFEIFGENIVTYEQIKRSFYFWYFQLQRVIRDRSRPTTSSSSTASGATGRPATTRARTCRWSRTASATPRTCKRHSATTGASSTPRGSARRSGPRSRRRHGATASRSPRSTCTARRTAATA
jgi:pimeloyl-ACP methyl ester carboxylesterase